MVTSRLAAALCLLAFGMSPLRVGQWTLFDERQGGPVRETVARELPRAQGELEQRLGLRLEGRGTVVLCGSTESFRKATPGIDHRHTLGVAYPLRRTIYLNCQEIERRNPEDLLITLRHEVSHILVGQVARRGHGRVPLWFDEGVAVWVAGKVPRYDPREFHRAVAAGTLPRLAELTVRFPSSPSRRGVAYEQSESFVRFLTGRHGEGVVRDILEGATKGLAFADAFREAVGETVAEAEEDWLAELTPRWRWLSWVANTFSLFSLMALLALLSAWVYWRRRRKKYDEWDQDERFPNYEDNPWL